MDPLTAAVKDVDATNSQLLDTILTIPDELIAPTSMLKIYEPCGYVTQHWDLKGHTIYERCLNMPPGWGEGAGKSFSNRLPPGLARFSANGQGQFREHGEDIGFNFQFDISAENIHEAFAKFDESCLTALPVARAKAEIQYWNQWHQKMAAIQAQNQKGE